MIKSATSTPSLPETPIHRLADVAVDGSRPGSQGVLTYTIPDTGQGRISVGQMVWVPLRRKLALGLVLRLHDESPLAELKPIHAPVEPAFRLNRDRLATVRWLARVTACSLFAAAAPFLPPGVSHRAVEHLHLLQMPSDLSALTPVQRRLLRYLAEREEASLDSARTAVGARLTSVIPKLEAEGVIERVVRVVDHTPRARTERYVRFVMSNGSDAVRSPQQRAVVDYLTRQARLSGSETALLPLPHLLQATGSSRAVVTALTKKGIVEEIDLPRSSGSRAQNGSAPIPALTAAQATAWRTIAQSLSDRAPATILLHGVTGSGKTEVYLRAVAWCLRHDRTAIILVPEIALAAQVVRRFKDRFPGQVAVVHSALPDAERFTTWQEIAAGRCRVVVGPRSALFAPVNQLGLIVLDEEHEGSYKQDADPHYHARSLAEHLATQSGAVLLLGSATPAVETRWRAAEGTIQQVSLPDRVGPDLGDRQANRNRERAPLELPAVEVVDLRLELHRGNSSLFSLPLQALLERTLAAREQAILLLNRRGLATVVLCRLCGQTLLCPYCDIPLVYHADRNRLLCHRCNHRALAPPGCPSCGGALNYFGAGTQRVEEEVKRLLPRARVMRWDQDTVRRERGHESLLGRVERREVDVVVGTQMIAKGLDLPLVTAIGVVQADTMLHLPDFRSGERTFQLLTQVAGRAGRRAPGSRVIVQSYTPDHYAIQAAARHDYDTFYAEEIDFRRAHRYPPFARLVRYLFRGKDEAICAAESEEMARALARHAYTRGIAMDLLGPTPAFASRVRGLYQWQIVMRAVDLDPLLDNLPIRPGWTVDVDPQSLL
ncbi:MAG: primosomal protein N' [Chloroflexota bacterium]|nr:primosomal protein N' [Chloroflexota bacterium]